MIGLLYNTIHIRWYEINKFEMNTLYYICAKVFCNVIFHDFLMIRQESLKNKTFFVCGKMNNWFFWPPKRCWVPQKHNIKRTRLYFSNGSGFSIWCPRRSACYMTFLNNYIRVTYYKHYNWYHLLTLDKCEWLYICFHVEAFSVIS